MTRDQIQSVLRQTYDPQRWLEVLRAILPGTDVFANPQAVPATTPDAPRALQLARVRLGDRKQLAVLQVRVGDRIDLLRNRVGLRNLVARFIDQAEYHGVLAVFLSPQNDFRFTFAARMAEFDDDGNLVRRETAPRRYTYVLGPNESCRTAAERFLQLSEKGLGATMNDVIEAFSVEKLNREFFSDFSVAFDRVKSEIQKRNKWQEKIAKEEAQTLLNRLLFLYFVQRKGWLNRQHDYLFRNFGRFAGDASTKTTFIEAFLRPLFTKLSTEGSQADIPGHDLPFLNGGLFADEYGDEQHDEVVRRHHDLEISNGVIQSVFDDLLERYNFTIQEDSPTNYEVAIDPEMLGQIFEELILTSEESETAGKSKRHDTGSHYTRRPIVHYLCRDSLAAWLENQPPFAGKKDAGERIRKLLALDATEGIDDDIRSALKDILTPDAAAVLLDRLFELRACDPAVGSGAFPMGLLHELVNLARLCATRAAGKDPMLGERSWLYNTKKRIIERVIYGVDIQPQAVDICKLRLWLSLMVDYELSADPDNCEATSFRKALKEIEPLPNLDFKIRRANSLVDYIHGEPVELKKLSSESGAALALSKLSTAKREFFNARTAAAKRKLRLDIYENITELAKIELTRARTDAAGLGLALDERDAERVAELDHGLKELAFIAVQVRAARKMRALDQEDALERIRTWFDDPERPTFVWQFDFAEVFHREETPRGETLLPADKPGNGAVSTIRNGFDLAIGNPPYIRIQTLTKSDPKLAAYYKQRYNSAKKGNYDLYVCFVERGLELLQDNGQLAFIQPHKFFNAKYGEQLRELLAKGKHLRHIVHFGDEQIFPGATNYVCLLFLAKTGVPKCRLVKVDDLSVWLATYTGVEGDVPAGKIGAADWNFTVGKNAGLFERLQQMPVKLGDVADIFVGLQTSADDVFIMNYVSDTAKTITLQSKSLEQNWVFEKELLHPIVSGTDVSPYEPLPSRQFILFPYRVENEQAELIPLKTILGSSERTGEYLKENKRRLEEREGGKFKGEGWHRFGRSQNLGIQERAKLCVPRLVEYLHAAPDFHGTHYLDNVDVGGVTFKDSAANYSLAYLLALINSSVLRWFFPHIAAPFRGGFRSANKQYLSLVPFRPLDLNNPVERAQHDAVVQLVEWLVWLRAQPTVTESTPEYPRDPLIIVYFEQWANALVYELYFPAELAAAGLRFFELTAKHALPSLSEWDERSERLCKIRERFEQLYDLKHPLRASLFSLGSLELVRIIEGKE